ncbi:MAG: hypothetical protein Kow0069_10590 [Promethearchaeota archaeon]
MVKPAGSSGLSYALHPIPLGLESIAASVADLVDDVLVFDQFMEPTSAFPPLLREFRPDFVGISMSATEHGSGKAMAKVVRRFDPRVPIVAGGYHPTGAPEAVLRELEVDAVCRGEGEELTRELVSGKSFSEIAGLSFWDDDAIVHNPDRPFADLDSLPLPARHLRRRRGYVYKNNLLIDRAYDQMEFGRGCYGKCTFCCEPYMSRGKQRYKSPERAMEEVRQIYEFHGRRPLRILIGDPHILGQPARVDRFCDLLLEENLDVTFQVMSRTDVIVKRPEVVEKMVRAGMISWELGVESPTQADLDATLKRINLSTQNEAIAILRRLGAEALGTFVVGLPSHTKQFIKQFPDYARKIGLAAAAFGIATPFPGSDYWKDLEAKGLIFEKDWSRYDENHNVFHHPTMSKREIENLRNWCLARFWNLDAVVEQLRLDQWRVGRFRAKHKPTMAEFFLTVFRKLMFAHDAGSDLAESGQDGPVTEEGKAAKWAEFAKFMFDAWVDPRVERYFSEHPFHEVVDTRQFGKVFGGKKISIVLEDRERKKCLFSLDIEISEHGLERVHLSKTPTNHQDLLVRADLTKMFVDPKLPVPVKMKRVFDIFRRKVAEIKGWGLLLKLALFGLKEALVLRMRA